MSLKMWATENIERMEDLGIYSDAIRDNDYLLAAMCVHIPNIPYAEYLELSKDIPEAIMWSNEYRDLFEKIKVSQEPSLQDVPISALVHISIINKLVDKYNKLKG